MIKWLKYGLFALGGVGALYYSRRLGMKSDRFKRYGVDSNSELKAIINLASYTLPLGANSADIEDFLTNIAKAESLFGTAKYDYNRNFGLGAFQFDKAGFNAVVALLNRNQKVLEATNRALFITGKDASEVAYTDLKEHAYIAALWARLYLYQMTNLPIPNAGDTRAQAEQWKKYYNTEAGKGTIDGFIAKSTIKV